MIQIKEMKMVDVTRIHPNDFNPNVQADATFNKLVEEIREDGFDHPIQVVPCTCSLMEGSHFKIIGGEHRWKAAQVLGMEQVPASIYEGWDEELQKIKTVRRNLLTGELDDRKFTKLISDLRSTKDISDQEMAEILGFKNEDEFLAHVIADMTEEKAGQQEWLRDMMKETAPELNAVDGLSDILHNIFSQYRDTVPQSFMFFNHKGRVHLMIMMDDPLFKETEKVVEHLKASESNINDFVLGAFQKQLVGVGKVNV